MSASLGVRFGDVITVTGQDGQVYTGQVVALEPLPTGPSMTGFMLYAAPLGLSADEISAAMNLALLAAIGSEVAHG